MFWISEGEIFLFRGVRTLFLCLWLSGDGVSLVVDVFLRGNIVFSTINVGCCVVLISLFFTGFLLVFYWFLFSFFTENKNLWFFPKVKN